MTTLDLTAEIIDVRDIIERVEELETDIAILGESEQMADQKAADESADELQPLQSVLADLQGCGGDEQWRGDWYPITLIRDDYFVEYVMDLVSEIGDMPRNIPNYIVIDWEATAQNIQQDYSCVDVGEFTYWYR
jgi:hypothetical protein